MGVLLPFAFIYGGALVSPLPSWCGQGSRQAGSGGTRLTPGHSGTLTAF